MPTSITSSGITFDDATTLTSGIITPAKLSQPYTLATSVASTSGTAIDFTGIPSWVKRITVMFSGVSTNGTSNWLVQLGDSGGVKNTGYLSCFVFAGNGSTSVGNTYTAGFGITSGTATNVVHGTITIVKLDANSWVASSAVAISNTAFAGSGSGSVTLSGTLDRVRITTVNGTDTFDAGSINISYEG